MRTVADAVTEWLGVIRRSKSKNTYKTYQLAANQFVRGLGDKFPLADITDDHYGEYIATLKDRNPKTEKVYAVCIGLFYEYLAAKRLVKSVNMDAIRYMRRNETRKVGKRLRKMDMEALREIDKRLPALPVGKSIRLARAKALTILLSRSGLRAFEACQLTDGVMDFDKMRGSVIGKGDKERRFIFDADFVRALREYRGMRKDGSPYLFISHSRRDGKKHRCIETDTARRDVLLICDLLLSNEPLYRITPHQLRHLFVTRVWRETGDIKRAQFLAGHENIATTENYIHAEIDAD